MNIIQLQDRLKDLSDQQLQSEMRNPSGHSPQFLVLSELKRRKDMRDSYMSDAQEAQAEQPPMSEQYSQPQMPAQGIAQGMPQQPPMAQAPQGPQMAQGDPAPQPGQMPKQFAQGGIVQGFAPGGGVYGSLGGRTQTVMDQHLAEMAARRRAYEANMSARRAGGADRRIAGGAGYGSMDTDMGPDGYPAPAPKPGSPGMFSGFGEAAKEAFKYPGVLRDPDFSMPDFSMPSISLPSMQDIRSFRGVGRDPLALAPEPQVPLREQVPSWKGFVPPPPPPGYRAGVEEDPNDLAGTPTTLPPEAMNDMPPGDDPMTGAPAQPPVVSIDPLTGAPIVASAPQRTPAAPVAGVDRTTGQFVTPPTGGPAAPGAGTPAQSDYLKSLGLSMKDQQSEAAKMQAKINAMGGDLDKQRSSDLGMALAQAGFAMASGSSPYFAQNVGQGGMAGLRSAQASQAAREGIEAKRMSLSMDAARAMDRFGLARGEQQARVADLLMSNDQFDQSHGLKLKLAAEAERNGNFERKMLLETSAREDAKLKFTQDSFLAEQPAAQAEAFKKMSKENPLGWKAFLEVKAAGSVAGRLYKQQDEKAKLAANYAEKLRESQQGFNMTEEDIQKTAQAFANRMYGQEGSLGELNADGSRDYKR
jgi:hypothetical protein